MVKKTFNFDEQTQIILTGESITGTKKVVESDVVELTVEKRSSSAGFEWKKEDGTVDDIGFSSVDIDVNPSEVEEWFESA